MMVDYIRKNLDGREPLKVEFFHGGGRPPRSMAGGTLRSAISSMKDSSAAKLTVEPYCLCPAGAPMPPVRSDIVIAKYSSDLKRWYTVFFMAFVNTKIVRRSSSLLNYGPSFVYQEYLTAKFMTCLFVSFVSLMGVLLLHVPFVQRQAFLSSPPCLIVTSFSSPNPLRIGTQLH